MRTSPDVGTIRVDGGLSFTRAHSTELRVETIVTTTGSRFDAGSTTDPIPAGVEIDIVFRDTPINRSEDPDMLGHGLVAFGEVDIQGAQKEGHLVIKQNVSAGATSMAVEGDLTNWSAGDTILVVGTTYLGEDQYGVLRTQDELRTITRVDGDTIYFDKPLDHAHRMPTSMDADIYVANMSRNVTFRSENPDGTRGHVMLHNSDPNDQDGSVNDVRYAAFDDLGRTDKSISTSDTNPEGRYPLHLHQVGTDVDAPTSTIIGNAVSGSPGWGIVQHESRALVNDNVVFDITGGGIVSEWGNETGAWINNLVSSVTGYDAEDKNGNGDQGAAYSNQSRTIVQQDNIAANSKLGWNFSGHESFPEDPDGKAPTDGIHRKMFEREQLRYDPDPFDVAIDHEQGAIADFTGNVSMTTTEAFRVYHRQFADHSDTMSVIRDFDIWGGKDGINLLNYAVNYTFIDSDWSGSGIAFTMWGKNSAAVMNDIDVSDFGLLWRGHGISHEAVLYDVRTQNVDELYDIKYDNTRGDTDYWTDYFAQFGVDYQNPLPKVLSKDQADPNAGLTFKLGADADVRLSPTDNSVHVTGTVTDGLGERGFYENIVGSLSNQASSYDGASLKLVNYDTEWHKNYSRDEFLSEHGTWQKADGTWVAPVVFWLTERLTGAQHPVIVELALDGFQDSYLAKFALGAYPTPKIDNADFDYGFPINYDGATGGYVGPTPPEDPAPDEPTDDPTVVVDDPEPEPELDQQEDPAPPPADPPAEDPVPMPEDPTPNDMIWDSSVNVIRGTDEDDTIRGTDGDDVLIAEAGDDKLIGLNGADVFVLDARDASAGVKNEIKDFDLTEGDSLAIVGVPDALAAADPATWMRFVKSGTLGHLEVDLDGSGFSLLGVFRNGRDLTVDKLLSGGALAIGTEGDETADPTTDTSADADGNFSLALSDTQIDQDEASAVKVTISGLDSDATALVGVRSGDAGSGQLVSVEAATNGSVILDLRTLDPGDFQLVALVTDAAGNSLSYVGADLTLAPPPALPDPDQPTDQDAPTHSGTDGHDFMSGSGTDDILHGNGGIDTLQGGGGDDVLMGGLDGDKLIGGAGADTFVFGPSPSLHGVDDVKDFDLDQGDSIAVLGLSVPDGSDLSQWIQLVDDGTLSRVQVDTNGGGDSFEDVAIIRYGRGLDLQTLLDSDALVLL